MMTSDTVQATEHFEYKDKAYDHCLLPLPQLLDVFADARHCLFRLPIPV
jgi:hypothetical protein